LKTDSCESDMMQEESLEEEEEDDEDCEPLC
jgi:hypothetical protein